VLILSKEDGSVRLGYSRNPTQCVIVLALRLVAGLLRPILSFSKLSKALSIGKVSGSATVANSQNFVPKHVSDENTLSILFAGAGFFLTNFFGSQPQQHMWNSKALFFPAEITAAHSLHFQHLMWTKGY